MFSSMIDQTKTQSIKLNQSRGYEDLKQKSMKQKHLNADLEDDEAEFMSEPMRKAASTLKSKK